MSTMLPAPFFVASTNGELRRMPPTVQLMVKHLSTLSVFLLSLPTTNSSIHVEEHVHVPYFENYW